jgi:hypothetical protein
MVNSNSGTNDSTPNDPNQGTPYRRRCLAIAVCALIFGFLLGFAFEAGHHKNDIYLKIEQSNAVMLAPQDGDRVFLTSANGGNFHFLRPGYPCKESKDSNQCTITTEHPGLYYYTCTGPKGEPGACLDPGQDTSNTTTLYGSYGFGSKLLNELGMGKNPSDKPSPQAALGSGDKTLAQVSISCVDGKATLDRPNLTVSYQNQNIQWLDNGYTFNFTLPKENDKSAICESGKLFNNSNNACILKSVSVGNTWNYTLSVVDCAQTLDATLTVNP